MGTGRGLRDQRSNRGAECRLTGMSGGAPLGKNFACGMQRGIACPMADKASIRDDQPRAWPRGEARYWLCQGAGWGGVFVLTMLVTIVSSSVSAEEGHRWQRDLVFTTFSCLGGLAYTHALRTLMVARSWLLLPGRSQALLLATAWVLGTAVLCLAGRQLIRAMDANVSSPPLIAYVMMNGLLIGMWICVYVLYHIQEAWTLSKLRESQLRSSSVEAQLAALQGRMSPHFLFNALNVIRALVPAEAVAAREAITSLADLLRAILVQGCRRGITLAEDLAVMHTYLAIERLRFDSALQVEVHVAEAAEACLVPPLLCLTLAENAIKHGVQQSRHGGVLRLSAAIKTGRLELSFENPCGPAALHPAESLGTGLHNLRERVRLIHGEASSVTLTLITADNLCRVTVVLEAPAQVKNP